jgi:hypothetical protein
MQVTGHNGNIIKPRVAKSQKEQTIRIREKAEVFTPSWICNKQNNLVDNAWFGYENIFNKETENGWQSIKRQVKFLIKITKELARLYKNYKNGNFLWRSSIFGKSL